MERIPVRHFISGLWLSLAASASWAQTEITFDVVFHTVYEASGGFTPVLVEIMPGPFNMFEPIPEPALIGTVTLTLNDGTTQLAPAPALNTITLNGSFSTESGFAPANSWTENVFVDAVFDFYAPDSYVALDSTTDPRDWPLITGTAVDGLISDQGPASLYGGVCPFPGGCLSANPYELFPEGTIIFDTVNSLPNFPTYADSGVYPLISGSATQTINPNTLAYDNGMDALVIEAVLDNLNGLQPYGDGVDGNPGIVRILTFSVTGNTTYMVEGSIVEVPVPVPAAAWLFASALGLLGWIRRRSTRTVGRQHRSVAPTSIVALASVLLLSACGSTSPPSTSTDNAQPVADAGPDQVGTELVPVNLDGSGSSDADGDPLTYLWEFESMPAGSLATLSDPAAVDPTFTPDVVGDYVLKLTVDDGFGDGPDSDTMTVTAEEAGTLPPVADAGPDQDVVFSPPGVTVNLDGTGSSDPDGDPLTYDWVITDFQSQSGLPPANPVMLFGADTATPFFDVTDADQLGVYTIGLTVSDGTLDDSDQVIITVAKGMPTASLLFTSGLFGAAGIALRRRRQRAKARGKKSC